MTERSLPRESYDPTYFALLFQIEDRHFWFRTRNQVIATMVKQLMADKPRGYRVLEPGCGTGNVLRVLERVCTNGTVAGMDLSLEGLRYARQRTDALLVQGDMHTSPFGIPFDLIGLFDVLEHLPDDRQVLRDLQDMLAKGGRLLLTVPAHPYLWSYFDEASHHHRRYERTELLQKLRETGYRVEQVTYFMTSIFPLIWIGRRLAALSNRRPTHDATRTTELASNELRITPVVNEILTSLLALESRLLARRQTLPWGTSLLAIASKDTRLAQRERNCWRTSTPSQSNSSNLAKDTHTVSLHKSGISKLDLSMVIVNWNARDLLAQCLESVINNQLPAASRKTAPIADDFSLRTEIFVVDNASTDSSVQMLRERFPQVQLIENQKNVGFARANNQAIRESTGRYVLLLNPDTEVLPGALGTLVSFMDTHFQVGAAGARLLNPDGTLQPSCHPAPTLSREFWRLFHLDTLQPYAYYPMTDWDLATPREVDVIQGACLILRREALDQVGLLDEDYFIYSEEVDLCHRLHQHGWKVYWVPQAMVIHYGGQSTRQMAEAMFLRLYQSKVLYFHKHYGRLAAQVYKLILLAAALARLLLSPLAWLERPAQRQQHLDLAGRYRRLVMALPEM